MEQNSWENEPITNGDDQSVADNTLRSHAAQQEKTSEEQYFAPIPGNEKPLFSENKPLQQPSQQTQAAPSNPSVQPVYSYSANAQTGYRPTPPYGYPEQSQTYPGYDSYPPRPTAMNGGTSGGFSPEKQPKTKGHTGLVVTVVVLAFLLVVLVGALGVSALLNKNQPEQTNPPSQSEIASNVQPNNDSDSGSAGKEKDDKKKGTSSNVIYGDQKGFDNKGSLASSDAIANAASYCVDSVVAITTSSVSYNMFYGNYVTEGAGSGVLWAQKADENGKVEGTYIVTNHHVIASATSVTVTLSDGSEYEAEVVGTDEQTDVAVILIAATDLQEHLAAIGDSTTLVLAQTVIAIGNPLGKLAGTVTSGIIGCLEREITVGGINMNLMQIDAAISPGNSGGGLFDLNGKLIGIVNAKSVAENVEGIAFAIPISTVKTIAADLIANGYVAGRPKIGVHGYEVSIENYNRYQENSEIWQYITNYYYANNGSILEGWYITDDSDVKYADPAKTFQMGDVITAINGQKISASTSTIASILEKYEIGDKVTVTVWRLVEGSSSRFRKNYTIQSADIEVTLVEMSE